MMITNAVHKPQTVLTGQLPLFQMEVSHKPVHDQLWLCSSHSVTFPTDPIVVPLTQNLHDGLSALEEV